MPTSSGVTSQVVLGSSDVGKNTFTADITNIAQAWFGGGYDYANGFYITSSETNSYKRIYARGTATEAYKPYIELTYYIPASTPTFTLSSTDIKSGTAVTINTNRMSDKYTHDLSWKLTKSNGTTKTGTIGTGIGASKTWTLTAAEVATMLAFLSDATSATLTIVCVTRDETGAKLGETTSSGRTLYVPADVVPEISKVEIVKSNTVQEYLVQGKGTVSVVTTATAGNGASLSNSKYQTRIGGVTYTGNPAVSNTLMMSGTVTAEVTVTDSRGRTATETADFEVYAYDAPKVAEISVERCNADGTEAAIDGEHLRLNLVAAASRIGGDASVNPLTVKVYAKARSSGDWEEVGSFTNGSDSVNYSNQLLGHLSGTEVYSNLASYDVQVVITDLVGSDGETVWQTQIGTQNVLINFGPDDMRVTFGRVGEDADPGHALITAMDFIAEAGVSLHGADVVDGYVNLPDGGMIAASAGFELTQSDAGAIRTLESVTVTAAGKNLMGAWELGSISSSTGAEADASTTIRSGYVPVTPGVTYAISRSVAGGSFAVRGYGADKNFLGVGDVCITLVRGATTTNPIGANDYTAAFTVNAGVYYLRFLNYNTSDLTSLFQMEIGTENTEYEPYREQVLSCDFGAPIPAAEVDFAAGTCRQEWGYLELDGTENWQGCKAPSGNWMAWLRPDPPAAYTPAAEIGDMICSGLTPVPANELPNATGGGIATVYNDPIVITMQPADISVPVGSTLAFSVAAQGEGLTYQWQWSGANGQWFASGLSTANTAVLNVPATADRHNQHYRCVITDVNGNRAISGSGTLTIIEGAEPAVLITGNPASQTQRLGTTFVFFVAARGEGLTYQWQWQGADAGDWWGNSGLSTANTAALNVPATADRHGQNYRCVVTDANGNTVASAAAKLRIGEKTGTEADIILSIPGVAYETHFAEYLADQYAAGTPVTVAYRLAQPVEHVFAPQLIAAQKGPNSIRTNADALEAHAAGGRIFYTLARAINALGRI